MLFNSRECSVAGRLLFIEPVRPASSRPVIDACTRRLAAALNRAVAGTLQGGRFAAGGGWMGWHTCVCGVRSSPHDYLLPNGMVTNSLAVHYLACHRDEVPSTELVKVGMLPEEYAEPTSAQVFPERAPELGRPADRVQAALARISTALRRS